MVKNSNSLRYRGLRVFLFEKWKNFYCFVAFISQKATKCCEFLPMEMKAKLYQNIYATIVAKKEEKRRI